jgi:dTDP-glucose 4,6-dehydratase
LAKAPKPASQILITGGAGFIGANFVLDWLALNDEPVINLDKLTYAGNPETLQSLQGDSRHTLVQGDIGDRALVSRLLAEHQPRAIVNFAAESHVDRSIHGPGDFIHTNIVGTYELLEAVRQYWSALAAPEKAAFRFLHVSTDEVYGSLAKDAPAFTEQHHIEPNSPYSAPARPPATTWCAPGTTPTACRYSPPTAATTTAPTTFLKSSSP